MYNISLSPVFVNWFFAILPDVLPAGAGTAPPPAAGGFASDFWSVSVSDGSLLPPKVTKSVRGTPPNTPVFFCECSCGMSEGDDVSVSSCSHQEPSSVSSPAGPRHARHRNLLAKATDDVRRSCAVMNRSPVNDNSSTPPHHFQQCHSVAQTNKPVCPTVRGPAGEVARDGSDTVPQLPKDCLFFGRTDEHSPENNGVPGVSPGGAFAYFSRRGEK